MRPPGLLKNQVKLLNNNILYIVIAVLVALLIYLYQKEQVDIVDPRILEYENTIEKMKQEAEKESKRVDSLVKQRDSTLIKLEAKETEDKAVIHEKFDKKRSDILILSDDESVQLLSKNLGGK